MKRVVLLLGLSIFYTSAQAASTGLEEVKALGTLNGQALACSQKANIKRIKALMISHAPKSRQYGAMFEQSTQESFLVRSREQEACVDAPLIALKVEDLASQLRAISSAGEKR